MRNNRGFGLTTMLAFLCFIGFCLFISYLSWTELMGTKHSTSNTKGQIVSTGQKMESTYADVGMVSSIQNSEHYSALEFKLKTYAQTYVENHLEEFGKNPIVITVTTLRQAKILDEFIDKDQQVCNGYVVYRPSSTYIPFLRCGIYETKNYSRKLE